jgi:uncharacterized protein (TIGR03437 family)
VAKTWNLFVLGFLAGGVLLSGASTVQMDGRWYNFKTVKGQDFGAGVDFAWNHTSNGGIYYDPGPPAWTFVAPANGATVTVLDGGEIGDVYNVWDNGQKIGTTSAATPNAQGCGDVPTNCFADSRVSKGTFQLNPGPHSITISIASTPYPNSYESWFRVESGGGSVTPTPNITSISSAAGSAGSVQTFLQPGSWASIYGSNLAATTTTWAGLVVNNTLPQTVGDVSVTIDGLPAYVYYVSPTQINVQVPAARTGTVNVVVKNKTTTSNTMSALVAAQAPAFFQWGTYAVATRFPDYAFVAGPAAGAGYVPAKPGDVITFWGTGFGPTTPNVAPGTVGQTAPTLTITPRVTVGGVEAELVGAALSPGIVGVYQIAVKIPASAIDGDNLVQASVAGVLSPSNVYVYVKR